MSRKALTKLYVSEDEKAELAKAAEAQGLTLTAYLHERLFGAAVEAVELQAVLAEHEDRIAELEAWHERSQQMLAVYEARGWRNPLEDPDNARILRMSEFRS